MYMSSRAYKVISILFRVHTYTHEYSAANTEILYYMQISIQSNPVYIAQSGIIIETISTRSTYNCVADALLCCIVLGSRGGRAVTRLASQAEDPGSIPGAGFHIIHIFIVYIHRIHYRPTDGDVNW